MNKGTVNAQRRVGLAVTTTLVGGDAVLSTGAAKVLLQMLQAASKAQPDILSQSPLAA